MVLPYFLFREKISDGTKNVGELNILDGTDSDILGDRTKKRMFCSENFLRNISELLERR